jgi:hypothetical protein
MTMFYKSVKLCSLLLVLSLSSVSRAALIPADIAVEANVSFDTNSFSQQGNVSQSGSFALIQGGSTTQSSVADVLVTGANPLGGLLSETNDGISIVAEVLGEASSNADGFYFDFDFLLSNSSLDTAYMLSFLFSYDNQTSASGDDAFADSLINLFDASNVEFFFSDLTTDTLFGDEKNGAVPGTFGVTQLDNGMFSFDIVLAPGSGSNFRGQILLEGAELAQAGAFLINASADLILSAVRPLDTPPNTVPLPATVLLMLLGLVLIRGYTRRIE